MDSHTGAQGAHIEYLTIFAPTAVEAFDQFSRQGLGAKGYSIIGQIGRHQITIVGAGTESPAFSDGGMVAATFQRRVAAAR